MTSISLAVRWIPVPGGTCRYGDVGKTRVVAELLVAETPLTRAQCGIHDSELPVSHVDHEDAVRLAAQVGGRLPTSVEWEWIAAGPRRNPYPWGEDEWTPERAVLTGFDQAPLGPLAVGMRPAGRTEHGVFDLAGNVWEWTSTSVMGGGYVIRGGSYASRPLYARTTFLNAVPAERRSIGISVRPVRTP